MKIISHRALDNDKLEGTLKDLRVADMIQINVEFSHNQYRVYGMSLSEYLKRFTGKYLNVLIHVFCRYSANEYQKLANIVNTHPNYKYQICISDPSEVNSLRRYFTLSHVSVKVGVMLSRYNIEQTLSTLDNIQFVSIIDTMLMSLELVQTLYKETMVYCYVENDLQMYNPLKDYVHGIIYTPSR